MYDEAVEDIIAFLDGNAVRMLGKVVSCEAKVEISKGDKVVVFIEDSDGNLFEVNDRR